MSVKTPEQIFRFAPSPNGELHLGHAYSALLNFDMAREVGGKMLLRFEDIDVQRCSREYEKGILEDLEWLGVEWSGEVRRQSDHFDEYESVLSKLEKLGLLYPAFMSRSEIRKFVDDTLRTWWFDPDGVPHYPGTEREWSQSKIDEALATHKRYKKRLDIRKAQVAFPESLFWREKGENIESDPFHWGDVVLGRSDCPASYHLCVVVDDALAGVNHIVRGNDLYHSTILHVLLQRILDLPTPVYHHHDLIRDEQGRKLSKSEGDVSLSYWRKKGMSSDDVRVHLGLAT